MNKLLSTLLFTLLISLTLQSQWTLSRRQPQKLSGNQRFLASAASTGNVTTLGKNPFTVNAIMADDEITPMMVMLYTHETFLSNCSQFEKYNCKAFEGCIPSDGKDSSTFTYLDFEVTGPSAVANIHIDSDGNKTNLLWGAYQKFIKYADTCTNTQKSEAQGGIGLNANSNSSKEFPQKEFGVFMDGEDNLKILFGLDTQFRKDHIVDIPGINNLRINATSMKMGDDSFIPKATQMIFDFNIETFVFPSDVYDQTITALKNHGVDCTDNTDPKDYRANCTYSGEKNFSTELPPVDITAKGSDIKSFLYPEMILESQGGSETQLYLLIARGSTDTQCTNCHVVSGLWKDYIVLGEAFFKKYYTNFEFNKVSEPVISLYVANPKGNGGIDNGDSNILSKVLLWIVVGIAIIVIGYLVYAKIKGKKPRARLMSFQTVGQPDNTQQGLVKNPN